jgi:hypothetical protein
MQSIDFQGITFIPDSPVLPISMEVLESVEAQMGFTFPVDYRAFITTFGPGETEFGFQAWSPKDILKFGVGEMRNRLAEFWFWDDSPDILTQAQAIECVPFFVAVMVMIFFFIHLIGAAGLFLGMRLQMSSSCSRFRSFVVFIFSVMTTYMLHIGFKYGQSCPPHKQTH